MKRRGIFYTNKCRIVINRDGYTAFVILCNRKDLVTLMRESSFLLHKRSVKDAHAAKRNFTAKRCCGSAQNELRTSKIEGIEELKWDRLLCYRSIIPLSLADLRISSGQMDT